jgi:PhzF family phenazine biosynthesis protein
MNLEIHDYLAFTDSAKGGNGAAIVFGLDMDSDQKMQELAASLNAPATVFVGISEKLFDEESVLPLRLRFFTPELEENICGHGTVAAIHAIAARGEINGWKIPSGEFQIELHDGIVNAKLERGTARAQRGVEVDTAWLEYGVARAWEVDIDPEDVALALGLEIDELHEDMPVLAATAGRAKLICGVPSTSYLDAIEPDLDRIKALNLETQTTGLVAFTFPGRGGCFTDSRHFAPLAGIAEDIATGNAHAALAAYLAREKFFDDGLRIFSGAQGYALGKPSKLEVRCEVKNLEVSSVWVGGCAVRVES